MTTLRVGDTEVATYVTEPDLDIRLGPRPYLHPVRTLDGTLVSDEKPYDHPWHLGASLTVADVNGTNIWGGRTYVRDEGYVWLDDHGRVKHEGWSGQDELLRWTDGEDRTLLTERRQIAATSAPGGWELSFRYALSAPDSHDVTLGSPATNGRTGGAGYGGFFWRLPNGKATAFTADPDTDPHGSTADWVAVTVDDAYTLVFRGLSGDDRWFVRTEGYNGAGSALAWEKPLVIPAGGSIERHLRVLVADGVLDPSTLRH